MSWVEYVRFMANPSDPRYKYVELSVHVWYDQKLKQVMLASNDSELDMILSIKRNTAPDRAVRALLASYGKLPSET
jgi:hypothetical protein